VLLGREAADSDADLGQDDQGCSDVDAVDPLDPGEEAEVLVAYLESRLGAGPLHFIDGPARVPQSWETHNSRVQRDHGTGRAGL